MARKLRITHEWQLIAIDDALYYLKIARKTLTRAECPSAEKAVRRAIKSAEGAKRHAHRAYTTNRK